VQWDDEMRESVEVALNEADVLGIRLDASGAWCDLLLHVLALPENGPIDSDARRILRLTSPTQINVLLRRDQTGSTGYGPVIPLASLDAVEEFFASLSRTDSMYGWKFLDDPARIHSWPAQPSLTLQVRSGAGSHSLFWFNECGREEDDTYIAYCLEGTVTFEDLEVLRADGTPQPLAEFAGDGRRYWEGLHGHDARLSTEAQRAAQNVTPTWRPYTRNAVTVSISDDPASS